MSMLKTRSAWLNPELDECAADCRVDVEGIAAATTGVVMAAVVEGEVVKVGRWSRKKEWAENERQGSDSGLALKRRMSAKDNEACTRKWNARDNEWGVQIGRATRNKDPNRGSALASVARPDAVSAQCSSLSRLPPSPDGRRLCCSPS